MNKPESSVHSSDLLACPFCGYEEPMQGKDHRGYSRIVCPNCGAEGPIDNEAWGLESDQADHDPTLWNRRAEVKANAPAQAGAAATSLEPVVGNSGISKKSLNILAADDYEEYGDDPM